jgi:hypothetical protein
MICFYWMKNTAVNKSASQYEMVIEDCHKNHYESWRDNGDIFWKGGFWSLQIFYWEKDLTNSNNRGYSLLYAIDLDFQLI